MNLKDFWSIYTQSSTENDDTRWKSAKVISERALEIFLHVYYESLLEIDVVSQIFEMKNMANKLCQEFMNDIIRVTNASTSEDDLSELENYLLRGRGWLILFIIYKHGVQELSLQRDLAKLLVNLLPFCLKFPQNENTEETESLFQDIPSLHNSLQQIQSSTKWQKLAKQRNNAIPIAYKQGDQKPKKISFTPKKHKRISVLPESQDSSQSDDKEEGVNQERTRKPRKHIRRRLLSGLRESLNHQESVQEEEDEDLMMLMDGYNLSHLVCNRQDLCILILKLMEDVGVQDLHASVSKVVSPVMLPHLLHVFLSLYPSASGEAEDLLAIDWSKADGVRLQRYLLRVVVTLCGVISTQQNGVSVILGHKLVTVLLDIAQQLSHVQRIKYQMSLAQERDPSEKLLFRDEDLHLFSEIIFALLLILEFVFQNLPFNLVYIKNAVQMMASFEEGHGFKLCEQVIKLYDDKMNQINSENNEIEPLKIIRSLINTFKSVKVNYIHAVTCLRKKHQKCDFSHCFNHHHDILDVSVSMADSRVFLEQSTDMSPSSNTCLVNIWSFFLLNVLPKVENKLCQIEILTTSLMSGVCCCMKLDNVLQNVISSLSGTTSQVQSFGLELLNKVILDVYGGRRQNPHSKDTGYHRHVKPKTLFCLKCQDEIARTVNSFNKEEAKTFNPDSGFSSREINPKDNVKNESKKLICKWSVLKQFKKALFSSNKVFSEVTSKSLFTLSMEGSTEVKENLFHHVYIPAFQTILGIENLSEASSSEDDKQTVFNFSIATKVHCLSALPYLLLVDSVLLIFLTRKGIGQICKLLEDNQLRDPILKVFEALVLLDEQKLWREKCKKLFDAEVIKGGMVMEAFIKGLAKKTHTDIGKGGKLYLENPPGQESSIHTSNCDLHMSRMQSLAVMVDMWETCSRLCINSEKFSFLFLNSECHSIAENTLLVILKQLVQQNKCDVEDFCCDKDSGSESSSSSSSANISSMVPPIGCAMWLTLLQALLVVCSSCYKANIHKTPEQLKMWDQIKDTFKKCTVLSSCKLKTLFDVILLSANPKKSNILDLSQAKQLVQMYVRDDNIDDDKVRGLLQQGSDTEGESTTDQGYFADSEDSSIDENQENLILDNSADKVYFASVFRLLIDLLVDCKNTESGKKILSHVIQKVLQTLVANKAAVLAVCSEGLLYTILKGFWEELTAKDSCCLVRNSLMALIQLLSQHSVTGQELQLILQLVKYPGINKDQVLSSLLSIVELSIQQPEFSIKFPISKTEYILETRKYLAKKRQRIASTPEQSMFLSSKDRPYSYPGPEEAPDCCNSSHLSSTDQEVWKKAAIVHNLEHVLPWPPYVSNGFVVSLWMQISNGQHQIKQITTSPINELVYSTVYSSEGTSLTEHRKSEPVSISNYLHLVSVGSQTKMIEVWLNCAKGSLLFRVTSSFSGCDTCVLVEEVTKEILSQEHWHHLTVKYTEEHSKTIPDLLNLSKFIGTITLIVNGSKTFTIDLPYSEVTVNLKSRDRQTKIPYWFLGHITNDCIDQKTNHTWSISNATLYQGYNFSEEECFQLFCNGPSDLSMCKCDCAVTSTCLFPHINKQVLGNRKISCEVLVGQKKADLDPIRNALLMTFAAKYPNQIFLYSKYDRKTESSAVATNLGLTSPSYKVTLLNQLPVTKDVTVQGNLHQEQHGCLEKATEYSGGMLVVTFLVAKIFEMNTGGIDAEEVEKQQAKAIQILFAFFNHSSFIAQDFLNCGGNNLLSKVLLSSKSIVGYHTLKVLLDACTTESMIKYDVDCQRWTLRRKSEAVIKNPTVLEGLLLNWKIWERGDKNVMLLIFMSLASLIREDHPYQYFNIKQLQSVDCMTIIFQIYKEKIQEASPYFSPEIGQSVVSICRSMMGNPPDIQLILTAFDFLLSVHPAANSYIKHEKSDFYFCFWWALPENMKKASVNTVRRSRGNLSSTQDTDEEAQVTLKAGETKSSSGSEAISDTSDGEFKADITETKKEFLDNIGHNESQGTPSPKSSRSAVVSLSDLSTLGGNSETDEEGPFVPFSRVHSDERPIQADGLEEEQGLMALCNGLLQTLSDIVITMPDKSAHQVLKILQPDILILMANNSCSEIRASILQLMIQSLFRAGKQEVSRFLAGDRLQLLAAQLYSYFTSEMEVEQIISLLIGRPFSMDQSFNFECYNEDRMTQVQQESIVVYLALLETTVYNVALCFNCLTSTSHMLSHYPMLTSLLMEHGLVETLCNMIARMNSLPPCPSDIDGVDEGKICIDLVQDLLCTVAEREFSFSGLQHYQKFEEIFVLLRHMENVEQQKHGGRDCHQVLVVRTIQLSIMSFILQVIEKASQENKSQSSSVFQRQRSLPVFTAQSYGIFQRSRTITSPPPDSPFPQLSSVSSTFGPRHLPSLSEVIKMHKESQTKSPLLVDSPFGDSCSPVSTSSEGDGPSHRQVFSFHSYTPDSGSERGKKGLFSSVLETISKKNRSAFSLITNTELIDRFKRFMVTAVDLFVHSGQKEFKRNEYTPKLNLLFEKPQAQIVESDHIKKLFDFLYRAYEMTLTQDRFASQKNRNSVMWGAKDVTRTQMSRLMIHMLSNKHEVDIRTYILSYILNEPKGRDILRMILGTSSEIGSEMAFFTYDLLTVWGDCLNPQNQNDAYMMLKLLRNANVTTLSPRIDSQEIQGQVREEQLAINSRGEKEKHLWKKKYEPILERVLHKHDKQLDHLAAVASEVTQEVTKLQSTHRLSFTDHIKKKMTESIQLKQQWQEIVQNLTHPRAVWYSPESYPSSWQLDPTEGPGRMRKKFKPCHLGIPERFIVPRSRAKLASEKVDPPLKYLFEDDHNMSDSATLIYQLYKNEKIQHTYRCKAVSPNSESKGELLIGENSIYFVGDEAITDINYTQVLLGNKDQLSMTWPYEDVQEVHKRWYQLRDVGIEMFLTSGKTCILACEDKEKRDSLYKVLISLELPNLLQMDDLANIQKSWVEGRMTNYDYLTYLNKIAGRSFNDLMQYPVFPFILSDYLSDELNLSNSEVYRDLSKPISVQQKSREKKYIDNYEILRSEYDKGMTADITGLKMTPFHYGSHYSNSGSVLHFLVRVPPYTKMFLSYQDENFDLPDRSFHSVETAWRLASFESTTDVKELIPEFFFLPEMLVNFEDFDFGKRQNGQVVSDVTLPPWCKGNTRLFILIHRQVLESDFVSQSLHQWVDLVFGFKQKGEAAVKSINVFHPATYFGMDVDSVKDKLKRKALRTMVKTYGQTPRQLFTNSHPAQNPAAEGSKILKNFLFSGSLPYSEDDINSQNVHVRKPLDTVSGLKWGCYCGSPELPPPKIVSQSQHDSIVSSLVALPVGKVIGVGENSYCATMYIKQKISTLYESSDVKWAAILNWSHPDGILRIRNDKKRPTVNLLQHSPYENITCMASVPDNRLLFVGGSEGIITVYQTMYNQAKESNLHIRGTKKLLQGHTSAITCLVVCKQFSVLVSTSKDNTCIIWDLNRLSYVRSIQDHKTSVHAVAVSSTLGDIATVSSKGLGCILMLHTINAEPIAIHSCDEIINCLAFSNAPEGKSVNVVAGGLCNGSVRLWSSWDLTCLRDLEHESLTAKPVISLTFTFDSQSLYMSTSDGKVTVWSSSKHKAQDKFLPFL